MTGPSAEEVVPMDPVAASARWTAAARAAETRRSNRLFDDPLAELLAGPEMLQVHERTSGFAANNQFLPVCTRFFDDAVLEAVQGHGIRQVVLLGAGMDARAYRLALPPDGAVFEVDRAELLDLKQRLLDGVGATPRCPRRAVGGDLTEDFTRPLEAAGFAAGRAAVWVLEGVLQYLDETGVQRLLATVTSLAAPGSRFLLDVVDAAFLHSPYTLQFIEHQARAGMAWRFGTDDPEALLAAHGWQATATVAGAEGASFGRLLPPSAAGLRAWLVVATRPT
jgi:methyltransferase (TIGR00027 family)